MNNLILINSIRFIFLVLLQVLLLNNIYFLGYLNPMLYIIFVFLYPLKKEKSLFLILCFFLGLTIDFFSNSGGINAAAIVLIAYIRQPLLHLIQNKTEFDYLLFNIKNLPFIQVIIYIFSMTFIHHLIIFSLEFYKTQGVLNILGKVIITTILSAVLISFCVQLFVKNKRA
ncbi:MAG: rod shape-determining protein MreD [Flavobacteriaceae bacterium]|nr:rod shape-determining protein MreD [Flavobacteriaceae bacterium]